MLLEVVLGVCEDWEGLSPEAEITYGRCLCRSSAMAEPWRQSSH